METKIIIKSAYKYYDELLQVWNLFLFIEFCSISFCVQRINKNINKYIVYDKDNKYKMMNYELDIVYIFEKTSIVSDSIHKLKKTFGKKLKKISINKNMVETLYCLSCDSCNFFIYLLECAYIDNPQNIINNGIYAEFKKTFWSEDDIEILSNSLEYMKKNIIYCSNDFEDKVTQFIDSKYNYEIFISDKELQRYLTYSCDIKDCDITCLKNDKNIFFCQDCFINKRNTMNLSKEYNLCGIHHNKLYIEEHIKLEHSDTNTCRFVNWNEEFEKIKELNRIEKFIKSASEK